MSWKKNSGKSHNLGEIAKSERKWRSLKPLDFLIVQLLPRTLKYYFWKSTFFNFWIPSFFQTAAANLFKNCCFFFAFFVTHRRGEKLRREKVWDDFSEANKLIINNLSSLRVQLILLESVRVCSSEHKTTTWRFFHIHNTDFPLANRTTFAIVEMLSLEAFNLFVRGAFGCFVMTEEGQESIVHRYLLENCSFKVNLLTCGAAICGRHFTFTCFGIIC